MCAEFSCQVFVVLCFVVRNPSNSLVGHRNKHQISKVGTIWSILIDKEQPSYGQVQSLKFTQPDDLRNKSKFPNYNSIEIHCRVLILKFRLEADSFIKWNQLSLNCWELCPLTRLPMNMKGPPKEQVILKWPNCNDAGKQGIHMLKKKTGVTLQNIQKSVWNGLKTLRTRKTKFLLLYCF